MQTTCEKLLGLVEDGAVAIGVKNGVILLANAGFGRLLDLDCEAAALAGRKLSDVLGPKHFLRAIPRRLKQQGELRGEEFRFRTAKGNDRRVTCNAILAPSSNGTPEMALCVLGDLTALRVTEETFRLSPFSIERLNDAVYWIGADARFFYVNDAACRTLGYTREEFLSMAVYDIDPEFPADRWPKHWRELKRKKTLTFESQHRTKDGQLLPMEINANFVEYEGREYNFAFSRDIRTRKAVETTLREKERMEAIGSLAGGAAHSFGNVLNTIRGYATAIAETMPPGSRVRLDAERILDAADHAGSLTGNLASVAMAARGEEAPRGERVELTHVVEDTAELIQQSFLERGVKFRIVHAERWPAVQAVASELIDVLMDLFLNAADAMPGGGLITVDCVVRLVSPRENSGDRSRPGGKRRYAVLRVRDTGCGMSPEILKKVFDPFFTTKTTGTTFGLGLTMVRATVERWGGWVTARSREGAGSSFCLYIPTAQAPVAKAEEHPSGAVESRSVMIVDDNPNELRMMQQTIRKAGYKVVVSDSHNSALGVMKEREKLPMVFVVDASLPQQGSKLLIEEIFKKDSKVRMVVTSGFCRDYVRKCLPAGSWAFLQKPFDPERLVDVVEKALCAEQCT